MYRQVIKRLFDVFLAIGALLFFLPVVFIVAVFIFFQDGQNPFFTQWRTGLHGRRFRLFKLRTMTNKRNDAGELLSDEQRLKPWGKFIRKTSLDEIPQFLNVLLGDMSLIGPRPLLPEYLPLYSSTQARRHEVMPGITGWAQVHGRNNLSWARKFELDVYYVDHCNFGLDLKILMLTILRVLKAEDINLQGKATTEKFGGAEF
jgi:lipopolysaccharide/colanic/teichoic acid biosynthesis glycosyltransferase